MSAPLENYIAAYNALQNHKEANAEVFKAHEQILMRFIDAENELRDYVAITKQPETSGAFSVTVEEQKQEVYDEEKVLGALGVTKQAAIEKGYIQVNERPLRIHIKQPR